VQAGKIGKSFLRQLALTPQPKHISR
jgi:hypothetical protein